MSRRQYKKKNNRARFDVEKRFFSWTPFLYGMEIVVLLNNGQIVMTKTLIENNESHSD